MARRKQPHPTRPKRPNEQVSAGVGDEERIEPPRKRLKKRLSLDDADEVKWASIVLPEIGREAAKEVAEINLFVTTLATGLAELTQNEKKEAELRVRVQLPAEGGKVKVGALQEVSKQDLRVQIVLYPKSSTKTTTLVSDEKEGSKSDERRVPEANEDSENLKVLISGEVDGPDAVVAALAYLIRRGYISLKPAPCLTCGSSSCSDHNLSGRLRVFITQKPFVQSAENSSKRSLWKRAMQTLICWLRPEVVSPTWAKNSSRYDEEITENFERMKDKSGSSGQQRVFDPSALYDAVKPSWDEPGLDMKFPELLSTLRPYQRRAAFWMVQRERGLGARVGTQPGDGAGSSASNDEGASTSSSVSASRRTYFSDQHPLWFPVRPLDGSTEFYFNPFTGAVSLEPHDFVSYIKGGILADEMGLGKTVELLACILANPYKDLSVPSAVDKARTLLKDRIASRKHERVECTCGATEENEDYTESWVQCDVCDAWQHATCVGYARPAEMKAWMDKANTSTGKRLRASYFDVDQSTDGKSPTGVKRTKGSRTLKNMKSKAQTGTQRSSGTKHSSSEDKFVCGACSEMIGSLEVNGDCKATLVVCPSPILQQWQDEIVRHTRPGSLRVIVYEGAEKGAFVVMEGKEGVGSDRNNVHRLRHVSAHDLAAADIVLTTYDTLRADLSHNSDKTQIIDRSMRYIKRFPVVPTPLTRLRWWRVCLDEAQMVEGSTTRATEMALLLDAQNLWCVSGTPIQRGLDDLFGLLRFLQAEPFNDYQNWNQVLRQPYEAGDAEVVSFMHKFLSRLMWRSTKLLVKDELNLPPQEERLSWLRFSPVEAHFYRQQHDKCAAKAREMIAKYGRQRKQYRNPATGRPPVSGAASTAAPTDTQGHQTDGTGPADGLELPEQRNGGPAAEIPVDDQTGDSTTVAAVRESVQGSVDADRPLSMSESSVLSTSLLRLRQACCHPQVGSAGIRTLNQRTPMTMDEILQVLVDKAKIEAEENQRVLIGALNGLAALAAIDNDIPLAVSIYREALALTEENAAEIDVDPLQKLHTLQNLADVLERADAGAAKSDSVSTVNQTIESPNAAEAVGKLLGSKIPRTLRDDLLIKQGQDIKAKYMASFHAKLANGQAEFETANLQVSRARKDCEASGGTNWWLDVLTTLESRSGGGRDLVNKIRSHLLETDNLGKNGRHRNASSLALLFQEVSGLKYLVQKELNAIGSARDKALESLNSLIVSMKNPTAQDSERIANCPRDSENTTGSLCPHCEMDDLFQVYENRLLLLRTSAAEAHGVVSAEDAVVAQHRILALKRLSGSKDTDVNMDLARNRRGGAGATEAEVIRAPSETEQILSIIKGHATVAEGGRDAANKHLLVFETMKKEYSQMRALAKIQREALLSLDELNMATTRLTLQIPGEVLENEVEKLVKLSAEEVPQRNVQLTSEKFDALKDFSRAKGQLRYLKGLSLARRREEQSRVASGSTDTPTGSLQESRMATEGWHDDEEACPVCHDKFDSQMMVLPCGHLLCCKCCLVMTDRAPTPPTGTSQKSILCPTCRQRTYIGNIAFVDNGIGRDAMAAQMGQLPDGPRSDEEAFLEVKGSYGTKIEAVVRRLLWVKSKDVDAKVLIFSTWNEVLDVLEHALSVNKIAFARVKGTKLNEPIQKFRGIPVHSAKARRKKAQAVATTSDTNENCNVLLLPIERGGNGLNLVEAQHVILVEPLPNPALEAQAINRVHRIGQTRATCVHKFIVHDTVEESVYWLGRSKAELAEKFPGTGRTSRRRGRFALTLNDVSALFSSNSPSDVASGGQSPVAVQSPVAAPLPQSSTLTPAAAAGAAAEARLRLQVAAQDVPQEVEA